MNGENAIRSTKTGYLRRKSEILDRESSFRRPGTTSRNGFPSFPRSRKRISRCRYDVHVERNGFSLGRKFRSASRVVVDRSTNRDLVSRHDVFPSRDVIHADGKCASRRRDVVDGSRKWRLERRGRRICRQGRRRGSQERCPGVEEPCSWPQMRKLTREERTFCIAGLPPGTATGEPGVTKRGGWRPERRRRPQGRRCLYRGSVIPCRRGSGRGVRVSSAPPTRTSRAAADLTL